MKFGIKQVSKPTPAWVIPVLTVVLCLAYYHGDAIVNLLGLDEGYKGTVLATLTFVAGFVAQHFGIDLAKYKEFFGKEGNKTP